MDFIMQFVLTSFFYWPNSKIRSPNQGQHAGFNGNHKKWHSSHADLCNVVDWFEVTLHMCNGGKLHEGTSE